MRIGPQPVSSATIVAALAINPSVFPDGSDAAPGMAFAADPDSGFRRPGANLIGIVTGGVRRGDFYAGGIAMGDGAGYSFNSGVAGSTVDVSITRHSTSWVGLHNAATSPVALSVFRTRTDASNYQSLQIEPNAGRIITNWAGSGGAMDLVLGAGASQWSIASASGHLTSLLGTSDFRWGSTSSFPMFRRSTTDVHLKLADNSAFTSLVALGLYASTGGVIAWSSSTALRNFSDGVLAITNGANTDLTRLILGTNDANGIAIRKSGTAFNFRLGNDSNWADITAHTIQAANIFTGTAYRIAPSSGTGTPAAGHWYIYTDAADGNKLKAIASTGTIVTLGTP